MSSDEDDQGYDEEDMLYASYLNKDIGTRLNECFRALDYEQIDDLRRAVEEIKKRFPRFFEQVSHERSLVIYSDILQFLNNGINFQTDGIEITATYVHGTIPVLVHRRENREAERTLEFDREEILYRINGECERDSGPAYQKWIRDRVVKEEYLVGGFASRPESEGPAITRVTTDGRLLEFGFYNGTGLHRENGIARKIKNRDSETILKVYALNGGLKLNYAHPYTEKYTDGQLKKQYETFEVTTDSGIVHNGVFVSPRITRRGWKVSSWDRHGDIREEEYYVNDVGINMILHRLGGPAKIIYTTNGDIQECEFYLDGLPSDAALPVSLSYSINGTLIDARFNGSIGREQPHDNSYANYYLRRYNKAFSAGSVEIPFNEDDPSDQIYLHNVDIKRSRFSGQVRIPDASRFEDSVAVTRLPREMASHIFSMLNEASLSKLSMVDRSSYNLVRGNEESKFISRMSRYGIQAEILDASIEMVRQVAVNTQEPRLSEFLMGRFEPTPRNKLHWLDAFLFVNDYAGVSLQGAEITITRSDRYVISKNDKHFSHKLDSNIHEERLFRKVNADGTMVLHNTGGPAMNAYQNGRITAEEYCLNGEEHRNPEEGPSSIRFHYNGATRSIGYKVNGHFVNHRGIIPFRVWDDQGLLKYSVDKVYPNGVFKSETISVDHLAETLTINTTKKEYYQSGKLCRVQRKADGILHHDRKPAFIEWYGNGRVKEIRYYIHGQPRVRNQHEYDGDYLTDSV